MQPSPGGRDPAASTDGGASDTPRLSLEEAAARVAGWLRLFMEPGQVTELRALDVKRGGRPHTEAGFFDYDHVPEMAKAALSLSRHARGVYFVLNPLNPDLLARRCCRTDWAQEGELAKDKDVLHRRWLLVDADPVRDPLVSATDTEKAAARETVLAVRDFLRARGWPDPILSDSGNGYHLLYRVELPAEDGGVVERVLRALARRFDGDRVTIDRKVFNPARICKFPGTLARKGDHVATRPHRRARILEVPGP
jgi:hypothetical protein